jgi:hypothetical protein
MSRFDCYGREDRPWPNPRLRWSELLVAAATFAAGCTPMATVNADGTTTHHYVGYVRVVVPPSYSAGDTVHAFDVESIGIHVRDGMGVGYYRDRRVSVPLDCRLVVLVRTQQQLDHAVETLGRFNKEAACASIYRE